MKLRHLRSLVAVAAVLAAPLTAHSQKGHNEKIPRAGVQFDAPADWTRVAAGDWIRFKPKDEFARLGFVVFDKPGEATSRLGQMAEQFELSNLTWGGANDVQVGPFPGRGAQAATCTLKSGDPCFLWYATVNPGTPEQILIAYLVNLAKGEKHRAAVKASVQSLRKM
jgi:hypothetical protein